MPDTRTTYVVHQQTILHAANFTLLVGDLLTHHPGYGNTLAVYRGPKLVTSVPITSLALLGLVRNRMITRTDAITRPATVPSKRVRTTRGQRLLPGTRRSRKGATAAG